MYCPKCTELSKCGCKSCTERDSDKETPRWVFDNEKDLQKCPKCNEWSHPDEVLDFEWSLMKREEINQPPTPSKTNTVQK